MPDHDVPHTHVPAADVPHADADRARTDRLVDSDVDLRVPRQRFELRRAPWATVAAISAGGVIGGVARYSLTEAFPHPPGAFAWATLAINVTGCALIGVLMVAITEVWQAHALVRPFLGVGILGGYTTFSTYIVDIQRALEAGAPRTALAYLAGTVVAALAAVYAGAHLMRLLFRRRPGREGS